MDRTRVFGSSSQAVTPGLAAHDHRDFFGTGWGKVLQFGTGEPATSLALIDTMVDNMIDNLSTLKDDMIAFIEGHGMRRFHGFASEDEVQAIMWHSPDHSDGWKDFVELAKHSGAPFLTMHAWTLNRDDLDELVQHLGHLDESRFGGEDDAEDARWLRQHVGKVGFVQLGWAYQGSMFLYEASTEWYEQYQHLLEFSEEIGGFSLGETGPDEF